MLKRNSILFVLIISSHSVLGDILGQLALDSSWHNEIYLSLLTDFSEMNMANEELIISRTSISEDGSFSFDEKALPEEERFYRIHVIPKGDPPSTIIIGGRNHNHIHFIFKKGDELQLIQGSGSALSSENTQMIGSEAMESLNKYHKLRSERYYQKAQSQRQREMLDETFRQGIESLWNSSESPLTSLFLIYMYGEHFAELPPTETLKNVLDRLGNHNSSYLEALNQELEFKEFKEDSSPSISPNTLPFLLVIGIILPLLVFWIYFSSNRKKRSPLAELTIKERQVLNFLKQGLSNKDIANELSIELGTVKSHVTSILQKLNLNSRRDILDRQDL